MVSSIISLGESSSKIVSTFKFSVDPHHHIIFVEELEDNEGRSVTNMAERICEHLIELFALDQNKLLYLEKSNPVIEDSWALVQFTFTEKGRPIAPQWQYVTPEYVKGFIFDEQQ